MGISQSEILGFDTRKFSSNAPKTGLIDSLSNITNKLGGFVGNITKIFDNGADAFSSVQNRIKAIKEINKDVVDETPAIVKEPQSPFSLNNNKTVILGSIGLLIAGIVVARITR